MSNVRMNNKGQSIVEIVVALAIFSLVSSAVVSLLLGGVGTFARREHNLRAVFALQEDTEAVRSIAHGSWNTIESGEKAIVKNNGWTISDDLPIDGEFIRTVTFSPIYRDGSGEIVTSDISGATLDPFSFESAARVRWIRLDNEEDYLESRFFISPGDFSLRLDNDWSDAGKYSAISSVETGAGVSLTEVATSSYEVSGYLESLPLEVPAGSNFLALKWSGSVSGDDGVTVRIKTSSDNIEWSQTWSGPEGDEDGDETDFFSAQEPAMIHQSHNGDTWLKYKVDLTGSGSTTPLVSSVEVRWQ